VVRRDVAMNQTEDLNVKISEATTSCIIRSVCTALKLYATDRWRPQDQEGRSELEAVSRHRDATIVLGINDCRDDEGHRLAAALGAGISCRRGA
jgi:post-segregation antitoxin (ccd killing protein)